MTKFITILILTSTGFIHGQQQKADPLSQLSELLGETTDPNEMAKLILRFAGPTQGVAAPILDTVQGAVSPALGILTPVLNTAQTALTPVLNTAQAALTPVLRTAGGVVAPVLNTVQGAADSMLNKNSRARSPEKRGFLQILFEAFQPPLQSLNDLLIYLVDTLLAQKIRNDLADSMAQQASGGEAMVQQQNLMQKMQELIMAQQEQQKLFSQQLASARLQEQIQGKQNQELKDDLSLLQNLPVEAIQEMQENGVPVFEEGKNGKPKKKCFIFTIGNKKLSNCNPKAVVT